MARAELPKRVPTDFVPVLMAEQLSPPSCPPEVGPLLAAAANAHNRSEYDEAVRLYGDAETAWRAASEGKSCRQIVAFQINQSSPRARASPVVDGGCECAQALNMRWITGI